LLKERIMKNIVEHFLAISAIALGLSAPSSAAEPATRQAFEPACVVCQSAPAKAEHSRAEV
jgi:hypothetical protein